MAPIIDSGLFGTRAFQHVLRVARTWESLTSMLPKGGNAIWGDVDWSPEEGYECAPPKKEEVGEFKDKDVGPSGKPVAHYGRFLSFGRELAELAKGKVAERVEEVGLNWLRCCFNFHGFDFGFGSGSRYLSGLLVGRELAELENEKVAERVEKVGSGWIWVLALILGLSLGWVSV